MSHQKTRRRLSRFGSSRQALLKNMAISLLREEKISTTLARAKELRRLIDTLINLGKKQDLNSRRSAFRLLQDRESVELLFKDIALRFKESSSGYSRIIHFKNRRGDNAQMVIMELTVQKPKEKKPVAPKKKKEEVLPKEEKKVTEEKKIEKPRTEKEVKKVEEKEVLPTPTPRKEEPKGFLEGVRRLFRRKKEQKGKE